MWPLRRRRKQPSDAASQKDDIQRAERVSQLAAKMRHDRDTEQERQRALSIASGALWEKCADLAESYSGSWDKDLAAERSQETVRSAISQLREENGAVFAALQPDDISGLEQQVAARLLVLFERNTALVRTTSFLATSSEAIRIALLRGLSITMLPPNEEISREAAFGLKKLIVSEDGSRSPSTFTSRMIDILIRWSQDVEMKAEFGDILLRIAAQSKIHPETLRYIVVQQASDSLLGPQEAEQFMRQLARVQLSSFASLTGRFSPTSIVRGMQREGLLPKRTDGDYVSSLSEEWIVENQDQIATVQMILKTLRDDTGGPTFAILERVTQDQEKLYKLTSLLDDQERKRVWTGPGSLFP